MGTEDTEEGIACRAARQDRSAELPPIRNSKCVLNRFPGFEIPDQPLNFDLRLLLWAIGISAGNAETPLSQGINQRIESRCPSVLLAVASMQKVQF